jgi:glucosylceramidase
MIGYSGREHSKTPVVAFRTDKGIVVTAGNFTDLQQQVSVKIGGKYLNVNIQPHSFNTYVER